MFPRLPESTPGSSSRPWKRKGLQVANSTLAVRHESPEMTKRTGEILSGLLEGIEILCEEMERHASRVEAFFRNGGGGTECLARFSPGAERFLSLLEIIDGTGTGCMVRDGEMLQRVKGGVQAGA